MISFRGDDFHSLRPQLDNSLHYETTDIGLVHHAVCIFTPHLSLVLIASTNREMIRLS